MTKNDNAYKNCMGILIRELVVAMGCTEPIAIAFCAAKAREILGREPDKVYIEASGNIIKNVKSVTIPNAGGRKGIAAAAAIGIAAGDASKELEVIASVTEEDLQKLDEFIKEKEISVHAAKTDLALDITVSVSSGDDSAKVRITDHHTGIVYIEKNGSVIFEAESQTVPDESVLDYDSLSLESIYNFAEALDINDVKEIFDRQINLNMAIAEEGLRNPYGVNIGKVLLEAGGNDVRNRARAKAAAGSDARMGGCSMPVVINSGSGNQGMTVSVPVIEYHRERCKDEDALYRALAISNLVALHIKNGMGRLSGYCGVVSAGVGAAAAIAYLNDGGVSGMAHTIVNALAIASGIICDGAKASCAAKIAVSLDAAFLGYEMYKSGYEFFDGEGLVVKGVENTIANFIELAKEGMRGTDVKIIELMTREC